MAFRDYSDEVLVAYVGRSTNNCIYIQYWDNGFLPYAHAAQAPGVDLLMRILDDACARFA